MPDVDEAKKKIFIPVDKSVRPCSICGKEFEKDALIVKDGDLCPECRKSFGGMAFVYCKTCKQIVSRVEPGMSATGFLVKPGMLLHINECPICHPGISETIPEEMKT